MTDLPASGIDGGGDRCLTCVRPHLGSSILCERCSPPTRTDITSLLPLRLFLTFCNLCFCYLQPPGIHVSAAPKSRELLNHCIHLIWRLLPRPRPILLNAEFVESCESSDRLMVKLRLSGETAHWYHQTEFTVRHEVCKFCCENFSYFSSYFTMPRFTMVVLRQAHFQLPNTLFFLQKTMTKHGVTSSALKINEHVGGTVYWFSDRTHALDLVQFIEGVVPVKKQSDDDGVNATFFSLDILPICPDDMVFGSTLGVGDFVICTRVAAHGIFLMDPLTLRSAFLTAEDYWRAPCPVITSDHRILVKYLVLDILTITTDPPVADDDSYCLARAHIVRVSGLGKTGDQNKLMVRTHLGRLLKPGDCVLGYDVRGCGNPATEVILVKKSCQWMKEKSVAEPSSQEPRSVDTALDGIGKDKEEELSREFEWLGLIDSSPHQISKESQMLPTPSDDVPSNPEGKWLGDEAAADNTTMEWLPSSQLSSPQQAMLLHQQQQQQLGSQNGGLQQQQKQQLGSQNNMSGLQQQQLLGSLPSTSNLQPHQGAMLSLKQLLMCIHKEASTDSTAQTGRAGALDWQEEWYQKLLSLKELYYADLIEIRDKRKMKSQQLEAQALALQHPDLYGKLIERMLLIMQTSSKKGIPIHVKEKFHLYERQVVGAVSYHRSEKNPPQSQGQQFQHPNARPVPQQQPSHGSQMRLTDNQVQQDPGASSASF